MLAGESRARAEADIYLFVSLAKLVSKADKQVGETENKAPVGQESRVRSVLHK